MTLRLAASTTVRASPARVWAELTDWAGQRRWIPFTTVRVAGSSTGIGVRATALSGVWLGRAPIGLLDRFVVTNWSAPADAPGQLEVLHLGPYFTGPGGFSVTAVSGTHSTGTYSTGTHSTSTRVDCVEFVDLPGGRLTELPARLLVPLLARGFTLTLRRLAAVCED